MYDNNNITTIITVGNKSKYVFLFMYETNGVSMFVAIIQLILIIKCTWEGCFDTERIMPKVPFID